MAAYCAGDSGAFERLFASLAPRLHGFFMRSFESRAVADDLLQTTFLKLHRARDTYRREQPVRPWLFTIAARVRLDEHRKRKRLAEDFDEEAMARAEENQLAAAPAPEPAVLSDRVSDRVAQVRVALASLPESQRIIIHLHRFEGLTFAQIAASLGTTEGAVKLRAFRGYERLRKLLGPLVTGERPQEAAP